LGSNSKWATVNDNHKPAYDVIGKNNKRKEFKAALDEAKGVGRTGRRYLTDPPEALREPAATAPAEFESIEEEKKGFFGGLFGG
jgi:hypothetical protein